MRIVISRDSLIELCNALMLKVELLKVDGVPEAGDNYPICVGVLIYIIGCASICFGCASIHSHKGAILSTSHSPTIYIYVDR